MTKFAAKNTAPVDVLVYGDHPSAAFAAGMLKQNSKLRVVLALPQAATSPERLVTLSPALFDLHPMLTGLKKRLVLTPVHGLQFLSDKVETRSEHRGKSVYVYVVRYSQLQEQVLKLTCGDGVEMLPAESFQIHRVSEQGLEITVGKHQIKPRAMILASDLPEEQKSLLGIPDTWGPDVIHRFTRVRCESLKHLNLPPTASLPMSLDLCGLLCWGWLLAGEDEFQITVEQPIEITAPNSGIELLQHWVQVLQRHGVLDQKFVLSKATAQTVDLPLAGALAQEGVANRTLLIGPAGGFYSACGEDIYPGCWSAIFVVDVLKRALRETHLQDALHPYRQTWRTTLGEYLRGPQENLRSLLPLVYRNPAMTARLAEAILLSKSVVR